MRDYAKERVQSRLARNLFLSRMPDKAKAWFELWESKWRPQWIVVKGKYYPKEPLP